LPGAFADREGILILQSRQTTFGAGFVRLFDIIVSGALLLLASPFFIVIAVLIKLDSAGPVFFLQERVGKGWRRFRMFKFRKMFHGGKSAGPGITARFDPRVTRVGSWLERTKLDELPQLINVLLGNMSLVGPRPEIPRFTGEPYTEQWNEVLSVKPGLFGPNQITHRNESELFPADCEEVEAYYVQHILPPKLAADAAYAAKKSLFYDIWIIACCVWVSLAGAITKDTVRTRRWQVAHLLTCVALGELTLIAAFLLRFDWRIPANEFMHLQLGLVLMAAARMICFHQFAIHRSVHAFFNLFDAVRVCASVAAGTVVGIAAQILLNFRALSRAIFVVDGVLLALVLIGVSYLGDRVLAAMRRDRAAGRRELRSRAGWSIAAGVGGVVAMLYSLAFVWPGVFAGRGSQLWCILGVVFASRVILFPFLARRLPASLSFVGIVTGHVRPIIGHCALTFAADITAVFFLNIRHFSRGAVIVNAFFYSMLLLLVLTIRCAWGRKYRAAAVAAEPAKQGQVLLVGDGREVGHLVDSLRYNGGGPVEIGGIVTADPDKRTRRVHGVEVVGTTRDLAALIQAREPSLVMVLEDTIDESASHDVTRACRAHGVDIRVVPGIMQYIEPNGNGNEAAAEERAGMSSDPTAAEMR